MSFTRTKNKQNVHFKTREKQQYSINPHIRTFHFEEPKVLLASLITIKTRSIAPNAVETCI